MNLVIPPCNGKYTHNVTDSLSRRVVKYWNKLSPRVKNSKSVNSFKANLEKYKMEKFDSKRNYWSLSEEIFYRIKDEHRNEHIDYLMGHSHVAKARYINLN